MPLGLDQRGGLLLPLLVLLAACGPPPARAQVAAWHDSSTVLGDLNPGSARVATGVQLLQAFADSVGEVVLLSEPAGCVPAIWTACLLPALGLLAGCC